MATKLEELEKKRQELEKQIAEAKKEEAEKMKAEVEKAFTAFKAVVDKLAQYSGDDAIEIIRKVAKIPASTAKIASEGKRLRISKDQAEAERVEYLTKIPVFLKGKKAGAKAGEIAAHIGVTTANQKVRMSKVIKELLKLKDITSTGGKAQTTYFAGTKK